jgi:hypothetical protein
VVKTFHDVDNWFDVPGSLVNYQPSNGGWTIRQILEHISLTNHYLLILVEKGTAKALEKARKSEFGNMLNDYDLDWDRLKSIGEPGSFEWNRPDHMVPQGHKPIDEIRKTLNDQIRRTVDCLDRLSNGEGVLYKTMMSVNNLGKIDVYHYIYFMVQHAKRHVAQMEKIKIGFQKMNI